MSSPPTITLSTRSDKSDAQSGKATQASTDDRRRNRSPLNTQGRADNSPLLQRSASIQNDLEANLVSFGAVCITDMTIRKDGCVEIEKKSTFRALPFKRRLAALRPSVLTYGDFATIDELTGAITIAIKTHATVQRTGEDGDNDGDSSSKKKPSSQDASTMSDSTSGKSLNPSIDPQVLLLRDYCIAPPLFLDIGNIGGNVIWLKLQLYKAEDEDNKRKQAASSPGSRKSTRLPTPKPVTPPPTSPAQPDAAKTMTDEELERKLKFEELQAKVREGMLHSESKASNKIVELKLQFPSNNICQEWLDFIERESEENYLKRLMVGLIASASAGASTNSNAVPVVSPSSFPLPKLTNAFLNKAYEQIWRMILVNRDECDYLRQVMVLPTDSPELQVAQHSVIRILIWMQRILGNVETFTGEHGLLFARLFDITMRNVAFRALLFLIEPDEDYTAAYLSGVSTLSSKQKITAMEPVDFHIFISQLTMVDNWQKYFFLTVCDHPMAPHIPHPSVVWSGLTAIQQRINSEELIWIKTKIPSTALTFSHEMFNVAKASDAVLAFFFMQQRYLGSTVTFGESSSIRTLSPKNVSQVASKLLMMPRVFFTAKFRGFQTVKDMADHFQLLADQCMFYKVWELVWRNDKASKEFSDGVITKLWNEMANDNGNGYKELRAMFLPKGFYRHLDQSTFLTSLHGRIAHELITPGSQLASIYALTPEVVLFDDINKALAYNFGVNANYSEKVNLNKKEKAAMAPIIRDYAKADERERLKPTDFDHLGLRDSHVSGVQLLFTRILDWMQCIMSGKAFSTFVKSDATLFVNLFTIAVKSVSFRALLTMYSPSPDIIHHFAHIMKSNSTFASDMAFEELCAKFVGQFSSISTYEQDPIFMSFLYVAGHPTVSLRNDISTNPNPSPFRPPLPLAGSSASSSGDDHADNLQYRRHKAKSIFNFMKKGTTLTTASPTVGTNRNAIELEIKSSTTWTQELEWMQHVLNFNGANRHISWVLYWKELEVMLTKSPCIAFAVLQRLYDDNTVGNDVIVAMLNRLPMNVVTAHFEYCFDFESFLRSSFITSSIRKTSHFLSLLNVVRTRTVWKLIESDSLAKNVLFSNATQYALWNAMESSKKDYDSLFSLVHSCLPLCGKVDKSVIRFSDVIPLGLSVAFRDLSVALHSLSCNDQTQLCTNMEFDSVFVSECITEFKSFLDLILQWTVELTCSDSIMDLNEQHVGIFLRLLDGCVDVPFLRAMLLFIKPWLESDFSVKVDGSTLTARWTQLERFAVDLHIKLKEHASTQAYAYALWLYGYRGIIPIAPGNYFITQPISLQLEMEWIKVVRPVITRVSLDSIGLKMLVDHAMFAPFHLITRHFNQKGHFSQQGYTATGIQVWPASISKVPIELLTASFESYLNYLSHGVHSAQDRISTQTKSHLLSFLHFHLFLSVWQMFFSDVREEGFDEFFTNHVIAIVWRRMNAEPDGGLYRFFHLASKKGSGLDASDDTLACVNVAAPNKPPLLLTLLQRTARIRSYDDKTVEALFGALNIERPVANSLESDQLQTLTGLIKRLLRWTHILRGDKVFLDENDAEVFVELLSRTFIDVAFRAIVATFVPSTTVVSDFSMSSYFLYSDEPAKECISFIGKTLHSSVWHRNRSFLNILDNKLVSFAGHAEEKDALWEAESKWLSRALTSIPCVLSWNDFDAICRSGPAISYIIVMKVIPEKQRMSELEKLSKEDLNAEFYLWKGENEQQLVLGRHFLSLCATEDKSTGPKLGTVALTKFMNLHLVSDSFLKELLRLSFEDASRPNYIAACSIVKNLLFADSNVEKGKFRIETLSVIPKAASIILDTIHDILARSEINRDESETCQLLSLALLIEETRHERDLAHVVVPLSETENVFKLKDVIGELQFPKWLAQQCKVSEFFVDAPNTPTKGGTIAMVRGTASFMRKFQQKVEYPTKAYIIRLICSFFRVCLKNFPGCFKVFIDCLDLDTRKFVDVLLADEQLRQTMVNEIASVYGLPHDDFLHSSLSDGMMLYDHDHFCPDALRALNLRQNTTVLNLSEDVFGAILIVAMYLQDLENLPDRLVKCVAWLLLESSRKRLFVRFLWWFIESFIVPDLDENVGKNIPRKNWRNCNRFAQLTIEDVLLFANHGIVLANHQGIDVERDSAWLTAMGTFFIERHFPTASSLSSDKVMLEVGAVLTANTFIFALQNLLIGSPLTITAAMTQIANFDKREIEQKVIRPLSLVFRDLRCWSEMECEVIVRLCQYWICLQRDQHTPCVDSIPHGTSKHSQLIALLSAISWLRMLFIARNEGVGCSLILKCIHSIPVTSSQNAFVAAMIAIYCVRVLRKSVHIVCEDYHTLDHEFSQLMPLYRLFNILPRPGLASPEDPDLSCTTARTLLPGAYVNEFSDFGVTYCCVANIEQYYRLNMSNHSDKALNNTVVILTNHLNDLCNGQPIPPPLHDPDWYFMHTAPYLYSKYDCMFSFCRYLPQNTKYTDTKRHTAFFDADGLGGLSDNGVMPSLKPVEEFLDRVHLGRRLNRLHDAYYDKYGSSNAPKEELLKQVLSDPRTGHSEIDYAFRELNLIESDSILPVLNESNHDDGANVTVDINVGVDPDFDHPYSPVTIDPTLNPVRSQSPVNGRQSPVVLPPLPPVPNSAGNDIIVIDILPPPPGPTVNTFGLSMLPKHSPESILRNLSEIIRQRIEHNLCEDGHALQGLRIGETKVLTLTVTSHAQFSLLHTLLREQETALCKGEIIDMTTGMVMENVCVDAIVQAESIQQRLIIAVSLRSLNETLDGHFQLRSLHTEQRLLRLQCKEQTFYDVHLYILPSLSVIPFNSFAFHNVSTGEEIGEQALITFTLSDPITGLERSETESYSGTGTLDFPRSFLGENGVLRVEVLASSGYYDRAVEFLYFGDSLHPESTRISVCPRDMNSHECRAVLTWRSSPSDLDLYCRVSGYSQPVKAGMPEYPGLVRFEDSLNEEREGYGPESIVFSPFVQDKKYRFYVNNFTSDEATLANSGARMTIFSSDGSIMNEIIVPEEIVIDKYGFIASYWHVFDVIEGEIVLINELVSDAERFETINF